ncbi:MAG: hypothetical protein AAFO95_09110 [Cyanobacteria bacterium J06600_6]
MTVDPEELMRQQQEAEEQEQLFVTGRISQEVYPEVWPAVFEDALRPVIDLAKYGEGVQKFYFTFIVLSNTVLEFEGEHYDEEGQVVEIAIRIPLEELLGTTQEATIRCMEQKYLEAIDRIGEMEVGDSFDHLAFSADVEAVFAESDWYVEYLPKNLPEFVNADDLLAKSKSFSSGLTG